MRSQKLIAALLSVALAVSFLSGCGQSKAPKGKVNKAYFVGEAVWPASYEDHYYYTDEIPSEAAVTVNGSTYTGTFYDVSEVSYVLPYVFLWYKGDGFQFRIGAHNGKCYEFWPDKPEVDVCTFDVTHGRKMADAIVDEYISLDEYQVEQPDSDSHSHKYKYYREVDGIETMDYISILFDCNGDFRGYSSGQLGAFKNVKRVDIDMEKIEKAIEKRWKEFYAEDKMLSNYNFTGYEIKGSKLCLVKTEANQCALSFAVSSSHEGEKEGDGTYITGGRLMQMVVIVDYEKYDWFKP